MLGGNTSPTMLRRITHSPDQLALELVAHFRFRYALDLSRILAPGVQSRLRALPAALSLCHLLPLASLHQQTLDEVGDFLPQRMLCEPALHGAEVISHQQMVVEVAVVEDINPLQILRQEVVVGAEATFHQPMAVELVAGVVAEVDTNPRRVLYQARLESRKHSSRNWTQVSRTHRCEVDLSESLIQNA